MQKKSAPTILLADDELTVRAYVGTVLRRAGFQLLEALDGEDALRQLKHSEEPVYLLVTDIRMPRMDGIALARSVSAEYPSMPIIFISGYSFDFEEERTRHPLQCCFFLTKPFKREELLEAVEKCLRSPKKAAGNG